MAEGSPKGLRKTGKQLRGAELEKRIDAVIRELAAEAERSGREYVYNASEVARRVPTTRRTLRNHDALIGRVLEDLQSRRRMVTGEATVEHLRERVERLKEELAEKENELNALREHHVEIYSRLHANSVEGALLIRPVLEEECDLSQKCIFCGQDVSGGEHKKPKNVVQFGKNDP